MEGTIVTCLVCGHPVELDKATDVSFEGGPVYVGNSCLPSYFAWQELQSVPSYIERYRKVEEVSNMIEIVFSKCLYNTTYADLDVQGGLTIVDNVDLPPEQQKFIYLSPQKVRALAKLLRRDDVLALIRDK